MKAWTGLLDDRDGVVRLREQDVGESVVWEDGNSPPTGTERSTGERLGRKPGGGKRRGNTAERGRNLPESTGEMADRPGLRQVSSNLRKFCQDRSVSRKFSGWQQPIRDPRFPRPPRLLRFRESPSCAAWLGLADSRGTPGVGLSLSPLHRDENGPGRAASGQSWGSQEAVGSPDWLPGHWNRLANWQGELSPSETAPSAHKNTGGSASFRRCREGTWECERGPRMGGPATRPY